MIFFSLKSIKLAKKTSHNDLIALYNRYEEKLKALLYAGSKKEYKKLKKEYSIIRGALLYQYTSHYTRYINKLQRK